MRKRRNLPVSLLLMVAVLILLQACEPAGPQADWPYPRHDLANTGASSAFSCRLLEEPVLLWEVTFPEGQIPRSLFPVVADIDDDGRLEYIISGWSRTPTYWLQAFNIEDGSLLWERSFDSRVYWSAPVVTDVNNDGRQDIVLATDTQVMALKGRNASTIWEQPFTGAGMGMTIADVNADGWVEVVINDYSYAKKIYLLNGQDGSVIWNQVTGGSAYNIPTAGDLDEDGYLEILSHNHLYDPSGEQLLVWDQHGTPLWSYQASPSAEQDANAPPELGWVPDFGYISTTVADFNADGDLDIGWGTRCHYYLLDSRGGLLWRVPTVEGYGISFTQQEDGTLVADQHGTGGPSGYAAGVGNLDPDPALEVVLSFEPEYRTEWNGEAWDYARITPANDVRVFDGRDGSLQWVFQGEILAADRSDRMFEPVLADLTGDDLLDLLVLSSNGYLYAIQGSTGEELMAYLVRSEDVPTSVVHHLTYVVVEDDGIVFYLTEEYTSPDGINWTASLTLHALQVSGDCR